MHIQVLNGARASDIDGLVALASQLRLEVLLNHLSLARTEEHSVLNFLNFNICTTVLGALTGFGWSQRVPDWIALSLNDSPDFPENPSTVEYVPNRLSELRAAPITRRDSDRVIVDWCSSAFYYGWHSGGLADILRIALPDCRAAAWKQFESTPGDVHSLRALEFLSQWGALFEPGAVTPTVRRLEMLAENGRFRDELLPFFSSGGTRSLLTRDRRYWADRAFGDPGLWSSLDAQSQLNVLGAFLDDESAATNTEPFVVEAITTLASIAAATGGPTNFELAQHRDRKAQLLNPFLLRLIKLGRVTDFIHLLGLWYGMNGTSTARDLLVVAQSADAGQIYAQDGNVLLIPDDDLVSATTSLISATNTSLGTRFTSDSLELHNATVGELGRIDLDSSEAFEEAIERVFRFRQVANYIGQATAVAMVQWVNLPIPMQAAMLMSAGRTLPISTSLTVPRKDRVIRRAGIFAGTSLQTELEVSALRQIFESAGIAVDVVIPDGVASFATLYEDPRYDILWVTGHGEQRLYTPERASLLLDEGRCEISILEFERLHIPADGRRLLVLNLCEVGASPVNNGLPRLGLAASLAGPSQAVVSHLWPVYALAARAFGSLLAEKIGKRYGFFDAFAASLAELRSSNESLAERLESFDAKLANSIRNTSGIAFESLLTSSSAIFQQ